MQDIISEVRLWLNKKKGQKMLSNGYFVMGGKVKVRCAVINSSKGEPFVVLPYHEDENNQRYNDVEGVNKEATIELKNYILAQHNKLAGEAGAFDQTPKEDKEDNPWGN